MFDNSKIAMKHSKLPFRYNIVIISLLIYIILFNINGRQSMSIQTTKFIKRTLLGWEKFFPRILEDDSVHLSGSHFYS